MNGKKLFRGQQRPQADRFQKQMDPHHSGSNIYVSVLDRCSRCDIWSIGCDCCNDLWIAGCSGSAGGSRYRSRRDLFYCRNRSVFHRRTCSRFDDSQCRFIAVCNGMPVYGSTHFCAWSGASVDAARHFKPSAQWIS